MNEWIKFDPNDEKTWPPIDYLAGTFIDIWAYIEFEYDGKPMWRFEIAKFCNSPKMRSAYCKPPAYNLIKDTNNLERAFYSPGLLGYADITETVKYFQYLEIPQPPKPEDSNE